MVSESAEMMLNIEEVSSENIEVKYHTESDEEDELDFIQNGASGIMEGLDADDYDNKRRRKKL